MILLKRVVLDVLKPHQPSGLEFAKTLAECGPGYRVHYTVTAVDEKTETVVIAIEGEDIQFNTISETISELGASLHSVDEVEVINVGESKQN